MMMSLFGLMDSALFLDFFFAAMAVGCWRGLCFTPDGPEEFLGVADKFGFHSFLILGTDGDVFAGGGGEGDAIAIRGE